MIVLPLPPSVNGLYGGGSGQQRFKSKAYKAWLIESSFAAKNQDLTLEDFHKGKVELTYTFYFPDKRARDLCNYEKATTDFLVAEKFIEDDNCFIVPKVTILFGGIDKNSRVEVRIKKARGGYD